MEGPDPKEPKGWEGDWRLAFPEKYLKHQHLRGRDATLTISKVQVPALEMNLPGKRPKKERKFIISFRELEGREDVPNIWIPSKGSCRMIEALHGKAPMSWPGKRITLYPDLEVTDNKGVKVGGIRVRSKITERSQRAGADASTPPTNGPSPAGPAPEMTQEEMDEIARREREEAEQR